MVCDTANPWDGAAVTGADTTYSASTLTLPGVTTSQPGAMVVGGLGGDTSGVATTPPTGWAEAFEASGGQLSELAYRSQPTAGATGSATWTLALNRATAGWMRALRPSG